MATTALNESSLLSTETIHPMERAAIAAAAFDPPDVDIINSCSNHRTKRQEKHENSAIVATDTTIPSVRHHDVAHCGGGGGGGSGAGFEVTRDTCTMESSFSNSKVRAGNAGPVVFDLYEDDDDDDDDDKPLVNLLHAQPFVSVQNSSDNIQGPCKEGYKVSKQDNRECIELLLSDDDEDQCSEADDDDEPILADFEPDELQSPTNTTNLTMLDNFEQQAFQEEQERLHHAGALAGATGPSSQQQELPGTVSVLSNNDNADLKICFVCGASLTQIKAGYKGRLNHIKRCSKKHGVTVQDVRLNDDYELFTSEEPNSVRMFPANASKGVASNPYLRKNKWHGDSAVEDLIVGNSAPSPGDRVMAGVKQKAGAPSVHQILMAGARRAAKTAQIQQKVSAVAVTGKRPRYNNNSSTFSSYPSTRACPRYKKIPGTDFCCDGFQYANSAGTRNFFLTHFHADHYGGITKSWNAGTIYCSFPTANLVNQQLGVDRQYLHPLPIFTPTVIESNNNAVAVTVTLLNANHCPGAIMYLFEVGKRVILHVGDFRWNYNIMSSQAPLRPFCRIPWSGKSSDYRVDDLFLDTTYCDAQYSLPTQEECIEATVKIALEEVQKAQSGRNRILMLFGAYTIGKEAVYMAVAKRLRLKVYVDTRRYRILSALEWPKDDFSILTTTPEDTILWVVPLGHINMKKMASYTSIRMRGFSRDFDRVVGYRPTGWSLSKKSQGSIVGTTSRGNLTVHSIPYSEHSSFPELVECLECLNPKRIIPTVSVSKSQQQIDLLLTHWRDKQSKLP